MLVTWHHRLMLDADILRSLRDQVLDESESLVGLLRKCLALGAVTGSDDLRAWATNELRGYADEAAVPEYRQLHAQLFVDSTSGGVSRREKLSSLQVPTDLRQYVPEKVYLRQPIEELAQMSASDKATTMSAEGFPIAAVLWTQQLDNMFQRIDSLYYRILPSTIAGLVGLVRTTLVEIVIDLAKDVPLESLPSKAKVDSVVQVHVGSKDSYQVSVGTNQGIVGQGPASTQIQNNSAPVELTALLSQMRDALAEVEDPEKRSDAEQALDDFDEAVSEEDPKPEKIKRRSRALERVSTAIGTAFMTQAAKDAVAIAADHFHLLT